MADTTTTAIGLIKPAFNDPAGANTWGGKQNDNLDKIDGRLGGKATVAVGNIDITLSASQAACANIVLTGAPASNINVFMPAGTSGIFTVLNGTTGTSIVSFGLVGGAMVPLSRGARALVLMDGTNAELADQNSVPPGSIVAYLGLTAPAGYLMPFGQILTRASYSGLFSAYGTLFNTGGESGTQFRMPDLRGVTLAGNDAMGGTNRNILSHAFGTFAGEQAHVLTAAEMAFHTHSVTDPGHVHPITDPGHAHVYQRDHSTNFPSGTGAQANIIPGLADYTTNTTNTNITVNSANTGITIGTAGSDNAHNNLQPTVVCNWIVKT